MFFIIGISDGKKELSSTQLTICPSCGAYGRYQVYLCYTALSLFFIPILKWNRRYQVVLSCCGTTYELDPELGRRMERGEPVEIHPEDLYGPQGSGRDLKRCTNCGYVTGEDFSFCPKCGKPF